MPNDRISYQDSGFFSPLVVDYLDRKPALEKFYGRFPTLENFRDQIAEKSASYPAAHRTVLTETLRAQYQGFAVSQATAGNIAKLANGHTFTVTTGHQLNLFTGPLYFLYKIVTAINLARKLKETYPDQDFVPVYWMASEDHDFEEISFFNFKGRKFRWSRESGGPVGRLSTDGLDDVLKVFSADLGPGRDADYLRNLFEKAYLQHGNLSGATRYLANELFGVHGLVILDADDPALKTLLAPYLKKELAQQAGFKCVNDTIESLHGYGIQVNPREINLFYMEDGLRERIVFENGKFSVLNTDLSFAPDAMTQLIDSHPERFSPNVVMRPLYQEVILPNLCYIGGGGEIAYWLELKSFFQAMDVPFPILMVRNSVMLASQKQAEKADRLELSWAELFMEPAALAGKKVRELSAFQIDLSPQKAALEKQFADLEAIAEKTDRSFTGAVKAQKAKQIKGLENLEKRLLKAEKRKHAEILDRISRLQETLFPFGGLQERFANFSEFRLAAGEGLIDRLLDRLDPFDPYFTVIIYS